jgi:hypothetical protein
MTEWLAAIVVALVVFGLAAAAVGLIAYIRLVDPFRVNVASWIGDLTQGVMSLSRRSPSSRSPSYLGSPTRTLRLRPPRALRVSPSGSCGSAAFVKPKPPRALPPPPTPGRSQAQAGARPQAAPRWTRDDQNPQDERGDFAPSSTPDGAELNERTLPGDGVSLAETRFEDWLSRSTAQQQRTLNVKGI